MFFFQISIICPVKDVGGLCLSWHCVITFKGCRIPAGPLWLTLFCPWLQLWVQSQIQRNERCDSLPTGAQHSVSQLRLWCFHAREAALERQHRDVWTEQGSFRPVQAEAWTYCATYWAHTVCSLHILLLGKTAKSWEDLSLGAGGKSAATGKDNRAEQCWFPLVLHPSLFGSHFCVCFLCRLWVSCCSHVTSLPASTSSPAWLMISGIMLETSPQMWVLVLWGQAASTPQHFGKITGSNRSGAESLCKWPICWVKKAFQRHPRVLINYSLISKET